MTRNSMPARYREMRKLPPGAVEDDGMVAEPVGGWIAYHAITAELIHEKDRDALAWGRGPTAEAALEDARRRGCREMDDPDSPAYLASLNGNVKMGCPAPSPPRFHTLAGR